MNQRYLSPAEVEEIYSIKIATLASWRHKRTGPPFSKVGKLIRYSTEDLDQFMESHKQKTSET